MAAQGCMLRHVQVKMSQRVYNLTIMGAPIPGSFTVSGCVSCHLQAFCFPLKASPYREQRLAL